MDQLFILIVILSALGSGAIGGVFFAFSNFVMPALARVAPAEGIHAMQAINVTVLNRLFLGTFMGTGLLSLAGRRVPCVAVCDGEAGLLDNIGSIVGVKQLTLAVRKFSKCGRPDQVFAYQHLDGDSIVEACGQVLSETALEDLRVSPALLERLVARTGAPRPDWRELWPDAATADGHGS